MAEWDMGLDVEGAIDIAESKDGKLKAIRLSLGSTRTFDLEVMMTPEAFQRLLATAFQVAAAEGLVGIHAFDARTGEPRPDLVKDAVDALSGKDKAH